MAGDLALANARIVDGTGAPWFRGAVRIVDGRIDQLVRAPEADIPDDEIVDVGGAVVAPGFIDTHSHSDLEVFNDPALEPKVRQGVTTEVVGQDGLSMAPVVAGKAARTWQGQVGGLAGTIDPEDWTWGGVDGYLDAVADAPIAPNVATLVGHGTVRYTVMGMDERAPTTTELEEMADLVASSLEDGAIGLSTGLVYAPQTVASTEEVRKLAAELSPYGRPFVAHIRSLGRWVWEALDEFVDIGAEERVPLHLSHVVLLSPEQHGKAGRLRELFETARERGIDMTADQHPYTAASSMLLALLPPWVTGGGTENAVEHLRDTRTRERIRRDIHEWRIDGWENVGELCGWENVHVASVASDENEHLEGESLGEIADRRGIDDPVTVACDLLVEEDLQVSVVSRDLMAETDVREILTYDHVNVAPDGLFGGRPHPRVYGSYPRVLGHYARDENVLSLEEAVRKMTSLPARAMGFDSKGVIRPGMDADLVVFEPRAVESRATYENPARYPRGIPHVLVAGEFVVRDGEPTGNTPGSAIRA